MIDEGRPTDCPRCGCNGTEAIARVSIWGADQEKRLCGHCGHQFTTRPDVEVAPPAGKVCVPYHVLRCPFCDSRATRVTSTRRGGVRFHRCRSCNRAFTSREE